jgi:hypothetical protein
MSKNAHCTFFIQQFFKLLFIADDLERLKLIIHYSLHTSTRTFPVTLIAHHCIRDQRPAKSISSYSKHVSSGITILRRRTNPQKLGSSSPNPMPRRDLRTFRKPTISDFNKCKGTPGSTYPPPASAFIIKQHLYSSYQQVIWSGRLLTFKYNYLASPSSDSRNQRITSNSSKNHH